MVELEQTPTRPDTKIKIYLEPENDEAEAATHKELATFDGLTLKLVEDVAGNVFNRPYPFIAFRTVGEGEMLPADLMEDGDPMDDYFITIRSLGRQTDSQCGFVLMGYKTLNNEEGLNDLDRTWPQWTGAEELARTLGRYYDIERVHCWKAPNAKQDHFKYLIMIEIAGKDGMLNAKDTLQRFRIRKMSGYVALYMLWDRKKEVQKRVAREEESSAVVSSKTRGMSSKVGGAGGTRSRQKVQSQESIGAMIHNLSHQE